MASSQKAVLFVSSLLRYGGGERWMSETAAGLQERGYTVVLAARPGSAVGERAAAAGVRVVPVEMRGDFDPRAIARMTSLLRDLRPAVVCPNLDREIRIAAAAMWFARIRRDGARLIPRRGSEFPLKDKWHYRVVYTRAVHRVIVNSEATRRTMISNTPWFEAARTALIYNGIPLAPFDALLAEKTRVRSDVRAELDLPPQAPIVVLVGELNERKGQHLVVEAAPRVLAAVPDCRFVFVGDGDARDEIAQMVSGAGLRDVIRLAGFRADAARIIAASDVLVLPSRVEGFGYALVEAMALSLPVVATRASSIPEIVADGDSGFLHEYGDVDAIAARLIALLGDGELAARMGARGRAIVHDRFSFERMMDEVVALFFG